MQLYASCSISDRCAVTTLEESAFPLSGGYEAAVVSRGVHAGQRDVSAEGVQAGQDGAPMMSRPTN